MSLIGATLSGDFSRDYIPTFRSFSKDFIQPHLSESRIFALVSDTTGSRENTAPPLRLVKFGEESTPPHCL